jgi:hypothetical protein
VSGRGRRPSPPPAVRLSRAPAAPAAGAARAGVAAPRAARLSRPRRAPAAGARPCAPSLPPPPWVGGHTTLSIGRVGGPPPLYWSDVPGA